MINFDLIEGFEWDDGNKNKNLIKHHVSNIEAEQFFFNEPLIVSDDIQHSTPEENRYSALGVTDSGKKLTIIFTTRNNLIRVISARKMSLKESKIYYEKT